MNENIGKMLIDVSRLIRRSFDERARSIGVTRPQWQVLTILKHREGSNQGSMAELLEVEPITLCRMIDRLQDAELVERRRDPDDRRAWQLFLTAKAHSLLEELQPLANEVMAASMEGLTASEQDSLREMLGRVRKNLSRNPETGGVETTAFNS